MRHEQLSGDQMEKKTGRSKDTLVIQCCSELLSEYALDVKIFQQFYFIYVAHV